MKPGTPLREIIEHRIAQRRVPAARPPTRSCERCSTRTPTASSRRSTTTELSDGRCIAVSVQPMAGRRHGHHPPGHHRAAPLGGQDRAHGAARRADRPAQPRAAQRAARAGAGARQARRDRGHPPARPRPLQDTSTTRSAIPPATSCCRWWPSGCARWCARPTPSRAWAATSSPSCRSAIAQPADATALAQRIIEVVSEPYEIDGHQVVIGTSVGIAVGPADGIDARPADAQRRPGALSRQGRRPRHLPLLRAGDGRADAGAPRHGVRPAQGAGGRRVRAALPAGRQSREQRDQRLRGADPLAPSREGHGPARRRSSRWPRRSA